MVHKFTKTADSFVNAHYTATKEQSYLGHRRNCHASTPSSVKGKAIPITGLWGPEGSGQLRLQITTPSAHEGGRVVTPTHRPPLPPGISWYSFLEAESTPGHTEMSAATE